MPRRMSVWPTAIHTRTPEGTGIICAQERATAAASTSPSTIGRRGYDSTISMRLEPAEPAPATALAPSLDAHGSGSGAAVSEQPRPAQNPHRRHNGGEASLIVFDSAGGTLRVEQNYVIQAYTDNINVGVGNLSAKLIAGASVGTDAITFAATDITDLVDNFALVGGGYWTLYDTNPANTLHIPFGTTITAIGSTTVTLSNKLTGDLSSGDTLRFGGMVTHEVHYNLFQDNGLSSGLGTGHPDWSQSIGTGYDTKRYSFNTFYNNMAGTGTQGIGFEYNVPFAYYNGAASYINNNTMIVTTNTLKAGYGAPNGGAINSFILIDTGQLNGVLTIHDNYIDQSGQRARNPGHHWIGLSDYELAPVDLTIRGTTSVWTRYPGLDCKGNVRLDALTLF